MEEKWSIEKLDGSNWNTWKFQMNHLLMEKELWGLVDGSEVLANEARRQQWRHFSGRGCRKRSQQLYWRLKVLSFTWSPHVKNLSKHGMR